jgi:hypothetical protein
MADPIKTAKGMFDNFLSKVDPEAVGPAEAQIQVANPSAGGKARAANMSPKRRKQIAKKAAKTRWSARTS